MTADQQSPGSPGYRRIGWPMYPPYAEAGRAHCSVVPVLAPAADAAAPTALEAADGQQPTPGGRRMSDYRPGERGARYPFAADLLPGQLVPLPARYQPERTWLDAATAIPEPAWFTARRAAGDDRPAYARVYRTSGDPEDPEIGPCWHWRCKDCRMSGNGCAHTVLHKPGSWRAAMCGGLHHIHTEHPRMPATQGEHPHSTLGGRRRCDWSLPTPNERELARAVLCGRTGYPRGDRVREMAREVLALAGLATP